MPLSVADKGGTFRINKITGKDETQRFLESLGFVIGETVKDSRIALDKKMAGRIMVQP